MESHLERSARFGSGEFIGAPFIDEHLRQRLHDPKFVMVEFGHDSVPVAYNHPHMFEGGRAYIGIESWLRDPFGNKRERLRALHHERAGDQNIFYLNHDLGGEVKCVKEPGGRTDVWYEGPYDTETILPAESAGEVFASNVFSDPYVAYSKDRTEAAITEMFRITEPGGTVVIRETITPDLEKYLSLDHLAELKMEDITLVRYGVEPDEFWEELESYYRGTSAYSPARNSFYLFIKKLQATA